ncbi:hypothetical protein ACFUG9_34400 [Streptomyces griseoincarnatus]
MSLEALAVAVATGLIQAMASEAWTNVRPRITQKLGANNAEREDLTRVLDEHAATVQQGGRVQVKRDLTTLLNDYAETHGNAAATFRAVLDELNKHRTTRLDNVSNSNLATNESQVATHGGVAQGAGATYASGRARVDNSQDHSVRHGGAKAVLLMGVAGIAAVVLLVLLFNGVKHVISDSGDSDAVRTCGEWLRLPEGQAGPVARDIALSLGNKQAARDAFIVQNTQYNCGGVEDRLLADVLRP